MDDANARRAGREIVKQMKSCKGELTMVIRRFLTQDADETAQVIAKTLRISNSLDYPAENIEANINSHSPDMLKERAKGAHMYVVCDNEQNRFASALVDHRAAILLNLKLWRCYIGYLLLNKTW